MTQSNKVSHVIPYVMLFCLVGKLALIKSVIFYCLSNAHSHHRRAYSYIGGVISKIICISICKHKQTKSLKILCVKHAIINVKLGDHMLIKNKESYDFVFFTLIFAQNMILYFAFWQCRYLILKILKICSYFDVELFLWFVWYFVCL